MALARVTKNVPNLERLTARPPGGALGQLWPSSVGNRHEPRTADRHSWDDHNTPEWIARPDYDVTAADLRSLLDAIQFGASAAIAVKSPTCNDFWFSCSTDYAPALLRPAAGTTFLRPAASLFRPATCLLGVWHNDAANADASRLVRYPADSSSFAFRCSLADASFFELPVKRRLVVRQR